MTTFQKIIKYCAIAFAIFLSVSIIGGVLSAITGLGFLFGENNISKNMKSFPILETVRNVEVNISASRLEIRTGDKFKVQSNHKDVTAKCVNGLLKVKEKKVAFGVDSKGGKTIITIPKDTKFDSVDISTGAGTVKIDFLETEKLSLDLGAGEVNIEKLSVNNKTKINGGVGEINIDNGKLNNAEIDMGIGELSYAGTFTDNCEISSGIGEINLILEDDESNYKFEADKGIGEITIGGKKIGDDEVYGSGNNKIELSGGIGAIKVSFL